MKKKTDSQSRFLQITKEMESIAKQFELKNEEGNKLNLKNILVWTGNLNMKIVDWKELKFHLLALIFSISRIVLGF